MMNVQQVVAATHGILCQGRSKQKILCVSTDSRAIQKGALFLALRGKNFDGHQFVAQAVLRKISAVVVDRKILGIPPSIAVIQVKDTLKALRDLAFFHRNRFRIPVIAVTASAGKTTTKEMIATILSKKYCVLKNYNTENNQIGVAKTLLSLRFSHQVAVLELGTNHFGEIRQLADMARPTVSVFLNIGASHLEFLKNINGVFREKTSMIQSMTRGGVIIFNQDDQKLQELSRRNLGYRKINFSIHHPSSYQATKIQRRSDQRIHFKIKRQSFSLPAGSVHQIYNALAAISCGRLFKVSFDDISRALKSFRPPGSRQKIIRKKGIWVIDDTYNANPLSVRSALETLRDFPKGKRRFFVFGDMKELGRHAQKEHEGLDKDIIRSNVDFLFTIGPLSKKCALRLKKAALKTCPCQTTNEAARKIKSLLKKDDIILLKGSRAICVEKVLQKIF